MSEKVSKEWKEFKKRFEEVYKDVDSEVADYIAVDDILFSHVNGETLDYISNNFQLSPDYVTIVLDEFLGVEPRKEPLDFSPYSIFCNDIIDKEKFIRIMEFEGIKEDIEKLYSSCMVYEDISSQIDSFYEL